MAEVGNVTAITLITSGKDGVLFEGLTVDHLETAVVFVSPSSSLSSSSSSAAAPTAAMLRIEMHHVCDSQTLELNHYMTSIGEPAYKELDRPGFMDIPGMSTDLFATLNTNNFSWSRCNYSSHR